MKNTDPYNFEDKGLDRLLWALIIVIGLALAVSAYGFYYVLVNLKHHG